MYLIYCKLMSIEIKLNRGKIKQFFAFEKLSLKYYDDIKYLLSQLTIVGDDSKNGYNKSNFE